MSLLRRSLCWERKPRPVRRRNKVCPALEGLESRVVLYSASGNVWPSPQLITISFMPDGTNLGGGVSSNLISTFNSKSSLAGNWENVILQAAQTWAQQTNINFAVVGDDGAPEGSGVDEQGNSGFGDIRIGGYNFGSSTLALTYQPPPANNFSIAGNMTFNTGQSFNVGSTYDLYTVAMHEFGHALGLNESSVSNAVEYGTYTGQKNGLASDDIAGIRSIYSANGPRTPDAYNSNGSSNVTLTTAATINCLINTSSLSALVPNLDITTAGQLEFFSVTAPSGTGSTLELDVQSQGLSLLAPKVTVYGSNGSTVLASANGAGHYGTTLTVSVSSVATGESFVVLVQGADNTQMGTGRYALGLSFKGSTSPTEASPIVAVPDGNPEHSGGGQADGATGNGPYVGATPVVTGIALPNGVSRQDGISNSPNISILGSALALDTVTVYCNGNAIGQTIALNNNTFTYNNQLTTLSDGVYAFTAMATDPSGYSSPMSYVYQVTIDTHVPSPPVLNDISPDTGASSTDGITNAKNPTFSGGSEPFAVINLYSNGNNNPFGTTEADISGDWSYTIPGGGWGDGTYNVTATATDIAGTTSASSAPLMVVILTHQPQQPNVAGISPDTGKNNDGITTARNLTISGTGQSGTTVSAFLNGGLLGTTMAGTTGAWTFNNTAMTLANGNYAITAQATDIAGNVSNLSSAFNVTVETVQTPIIAGVSLSTQGSGQQSLSIVGTASPNNSVQVSLDGTLLGTVNANGQWSWSYTYVPSSITVARGVYNVSAIAIDQSENVSAPSPTFVVDFTLPSAPVLNGISPDTGASSTDGITNAKNPTFSGTAAPNTIINLYSNGNNNPFGTTTTNSSGTWSYTIPGGGWGDGTYNVTATATEIAGMTSASSAPLTVVIDTQQPQQPNVTGISPDTGKNNDGITTARNLTISGTGQPGTTVSVFLNGRLLGTTMAGTTGAWTFNNTAMTLANGNYAITAQAVDIAGNVSNLSNAFNVTVETVQSPVITGVSLSTQGSGQQSLSIVGTTSPNNSVQVSLDGTLLGTVNANGQGSWSYTYVPSSITVASGVYSISAIAIDQSENVSAASPTFQLQVGGGPSASTPQYSSGTLSGQATPGSLVTIVDGDVVLGVVAANSSGNWQFTPALSHGTHSIMAEPTNGGGLTSVLSGALNFNV